MGDHCQPPGASGSSGLVEERPTVLCTLQQNLPPNSEIHGGLGFGGKAYRAELALKCVSAKQPIECTLSWLYSLC